MSSTGKGMHKTIQPSQRGAIRKQQKPKQGQYQQTAGNSSTQYHMQPTMPMQPTIHTQMMPPPMMQIPPQYTNYMQMAPMQMQQQHMPPNQQQQHMLPNQ